MKAARSGSHPRARLFCAVSRHHFNFRNATSTTYSRTWMCFLVFIVGGIDVTPQRGFVDAFADPVDWA